MKGIRLLREYGFKIAFRIVLSNHLLPRISFIIPDKYFLINYYGGKIYLNLKESPMMLRRALGVFEYWKTRLLTDLIKPNMTIVDVGVNKGYYSLLFAKLMNDKGKVLSFEPNPDNCFWIRKSIEVNGYKCIKLYQCALSDKEGLATFYLGKKSGWGSLFYSSSARPDRKKITVKTRKLDDILDEEGIDGIDLIQIDVEGADLLVLKGAKDTLKKSKNVKLTMDIDVRSKEERKQLFEFLTSCGFQIFNVGKELKHTKKIDEVGEEIYATKT